MTRMETACLWTIGLAGAACGWLTLGLGPTLVIVGTCLGGSWWVAELMRRRERRRQIARALKSLQAAWEENRDATGGVT